MVDKKTDMNAVGRVGARVLERLRGAAHMTAVIASVVRMALAPRYWSPPVRDVLARQIYFTGVEAVPFIGLIALLAGVAIVVQAQVWLNKVGQSGLVGPLLVAVVIRELGPLLTNFIVIGRSGTAIASELAGMKVNQEIKVLDAQGLAPFVYLVLPRVLGVMVSVFCLTIIFIALSLLSGFISGALLGVTHNAPDVFIRAVFGAITPADVLNLLAKTIVPGLLTGAICCCEGMSVHGAATEVPQATGRAVAKSVGGVFLVSALVSLLTYM